MCATNFIRSLDSAFLRHGRCDYVIPIGLPDAEAWAAVERGAWSVERGSEGGADAPGGPTTDHYLAAIGTTRATVSPDVVTEFLEDIETIARL